eukprot:TRINITY_DN5454_c0_g2_i2.p2 TRINITY_DN5454_c0_g2~~TRINITY_DN5454_c0_g2_i2.p2  ORF type:complete len:508 (-),score=169.56 TRINITY_DN5454_c0_g2_i2:1888-3195(-)
MDRKRDQAKLDAMQAQRLQLYNEEKELSDRLAHKEQQLTALQKEYDAQTHKLQSELADAMDQLSRVQTDLRVQGQSFMSQLRMAKDDASRAQIELKAAQTQLKALQTKAERSESEFNAVNNELRAQLQQLQSSSRKSNGGGDWESKYSGAISQLRASEARSANVELLREEIVHLKAQLSRAEATGCQITNAQAAEEASREDTRGYRVQMEALQRECQTVQQQLAAKSVEASELRFKYEQLEAAKLALEDRVNKGEFNPAKTRVLHLQSRPPSAQKMSLEKQVETLTQENTELRLKLEVIEKQGAGALTAIAAKEQNDALLKKIDEFTKREARLKEVLKKKIQQFREATCTLTGFMINMEQSGSTTLYRLQNMYNENKEDCLLFQEQPDGYQLLDTPFVRTIPKEQEVYLQKLRSVPGFTSAITLLLLERQSITIY